MFHTKTILIVDDPVTPTMSLAAAIEGQRGTVVGPVTTRQQALASLAVQHCHVAVIDADLPEAVELIHVFTEAHLPYVLHASGPICQEVSRTSQGGAALFRPVDPEIVITMIAIAIERGEGGG